MEESDRPREPLESRGDESPSELRTSEQRFRNLFEHSSGGIAFHELLTDAEGNPFDYLISDINPAFEKILGLRKEAVLGRPSREAYGTEIPPYFETFTAVAQGKGPVTFDSYFTPLKKHFRITAYSVSPGSFITVFDDISDLKTANSQLLESEKLFRSMFEESSDAMTLIREDTIVDCNHAAVEMFGYGQKHRMIGLPAHALSPDIQPDGDSSHEKIQAYMDIASRKGSFKFEWAQKKATGEIFFSETIMTPIERRGRQLIHMGGRDITQRRKTEEALKAARDAAVAAAKAKSTFLANMSHEIRTPLNAILGYARLLGHDEHLSGAHRQSMDVITRNGEHLLNLINGIIELSKIEAGRTTLSPYAFRPRRMIEALLLTARAKARMKGITFDIEVDPILPEFLMADERKIRQILLNLIGNALKFTDQGSIHLRVSFIPDTPPTLSVIIEDTGIGIPEDRLTSIFDPFEDVERAGGTGLGLSISRTFARLMGGDITVKSMPHRGSIFCFTARVALPTGAASKNIPRIVGLEPGQPAYRLLVVDDNEDMRDLLLSLLTDIGFTARTAEDGEAAVEICRAWNPHLVFMDIRMPVMDGREATQAIRAAPGGNDIIIIAITAGAFDDQKEDLLSIGCNDFIGKPYSVDEIYVTLERYLNTRFLYEPASSTGALPFSELQTGIEALPSPTRSRMYTAAIRADLEEVECAIEEIRGRNAPLAAELKQLTDDFEFELIQKLFTMEPDHGQ